MIRKQNKINNILLLCFVVIFLIGVLTFSTIKVIKYIVDNKENEKIEEDSILTLSTCANNNKYRVIVHSVRKKYFV